jgi:phosphatidate cytidylyltransferase
MLLERFLVTLVLLPLGMLALFGGEIYFGILIIVILLIATWEFANLYTIGGFKPAVFILLLGTLLLSLVRLITGDLIWDQIILGGLILLAMGHHAFSYERGRVQAALDLTVTLAGLAYVAFLGSYFVAIRGLPGGAWWMLVVFTSVWWGDTGGYFIGKAFGRHKMAPRLSPKKSWEGYFGGIALSLGGSLLLLQSYGWLDLPVDPGITPQRVLLLAAFLSVFPTIGDFGISMLKRHFAVKDSGKILPGHGGMLDRIDSWLWAAIIGYYLITLLYKV